MLSHTDQPLSHLLTDVPATVFTPEIRIDCPDEKKFAVVRALTEEFKRTHDVVDIDGARIRFAHGWALVRGSNTQPVIVMRFEADTQEHLDEMRRLLEAKAQRLIAESDV